MNGRRDRIVVPAVVALVAVGLTLWLASGGQQSPFSWFADLPGGGNGDAQALVEILVSAGIVTVGIGYLCHALFAMWMLQSEKCRLVDFERLMHAFGLKMSGSPDKKAKKAIRQALEEPLLDEFHLRLHSHAPQQLVDHCGRRNTAWYIAKTSAIASILGWVTALVLLLTRDAFKDPCGWQVAGVAASVMIFLVILPLAFSWQGTRWNREFWGVCWKWIYWDRRTHRPPTAWVGPLPKGVERIDDDETDG